MSREYKAVMVALVPQKEARERLTAATSAAITLAARSQSIMTIDFLSPRPAWAPISLFTDMPSRFIAAENKRLDALASSCLRAAEEAARAAGLACTTESLAQDIIGLTWASARRARLQDIVVMDAASDALYNYREIIQSMLFRSGRPVMLVPKNGGAASYKSAMVAWDGSLPATRAVTEALPLLQQAEEVCLVTVQGEKDLPASASSEGLAIYLERHGVATRRQCLHAESADGVADAIREQTSESGAEMIVMGAYAHSRLQEAVLGGVTRSLLDSSPVALLMAH